MQRLTARIGFLRTQVARQTLLTFLTAALIPTLVSSVVGIGYVRQTLVGEATGRVDRTAESATLILLRELTSLAKETATRPRDTFAVTTDSSFDADASAHLGEGGVLMRVSASGELQLIRRFSDGALGERLVRNTELWSSLEELIDGDRSELCVFEVRSWRRMYCSITVDASREQSLREIARTTDSGADGVNIGDNSADLLAAHRDLYLRFELGSPEWRIVTAEPRAAALAPASEVTTSLAILIALATVGAFAFAHRQIRRDTMPLDALHAATRRVGAGDFQTPVIIASGDEYGELASAFNGMTGALSRQLTLLQIMDRVDDATLRERDVAAIANIALDGLQQVRGLKRATFAVLEEYSTTAIAGWTFDVTDQRTLRVGGTLSDVDRATLSACPRVYDVREALDSDGAPQILQWLPAGRYAARMILPLINDGELLGAIALDIASRSATHDEDAVVARRIADRVALGVANVRMLDRLDSLSNGTLLAFARAIDANSPWTAGHSERVTQLAISLGRQLGLSQSDLQTLYRGGLMHDIGKIGIPAHVLDKAGRLDDEERAMIEKHPEIGERILRPIPAFADALSIVRSHHERFDGTGYPDRLAGEDIPWLARILAVADVFDALASDRPYRAGLSHRATITIIEGSSGTHFDPRVVEALLGLEQLMPSALARIGALHEIPVRVGASMSTPHTTSAAVA